ncbi:MAG TPA: DUF1905 domain-containing protein [Nocardioides sp.]|uniref:DUF1905 domain-containing protein n=1 Tax=Nocardioides sp. TaxID=35761 RepID=UPI002CD4E6EB|nr:DUF1905 domain-containing protein [Nocardioides sp.]HQR26240.1 DUF1905 domain-containing protein [Nocardioides sp.]
MSEAHRFSAELWEAGAADAWVFLTLPPDVSEEIREVPRPPRGFGSVRVEVTVGGTTWRTSVFPDARSGCYVLPVKRAVRQAEDLEVGDTAQVGLVLV